MYKTIPYEKIQEIARDVTKGYNPVPLPRLEEVSWAFPVEGRDRCHYIKQGHSDRILNTQEGNAMYQLMLFRNFDNVLTKLSNEQYSGKIPNHTMPVGGAEDMAYMHTDFWAMLPENIKKKNFPSLELPRHKGLYWEKISPDLVKLALVADGNCRGRKTDEWGIHGTKDRAGEIAYVTEELTRAYLENVRKFSEMGREYLVDIANSKETAKNYEQLVLAKEVSSWKPGQTYQIGAYWSGVPGICWGIVKNNDGSMITSDLITPQEKELSKLPMEVSYKVSSLEKLANDRGTLWELK